MKNYLIGILVVIAFSCKKDDTSTYDIPNVSSPYQIENGYIKFRTNDDYISTIILLSQLTSEERRKWEGDIKFKSFASYFEDFENKFNEADSLQDVNIFNKAKESYSKYLQWQGDTMYTINAPSMLIAKVADRNGIFKISDTYYLNTANGSFMMPNKSYQEIIALKRAPQFSQRVSEVMSDPGVLSGSIPSNNSSKTSSLLWQTSSDGRGRFYVRLRLYNLHSTTLGYRSFATLEYYARTRSIFGAYKDAYADVIRIDKWLSLTFSDNTSVGVSYDLNPGWSESKGTTENIILISETLKNEGLANHPLSSYANKFSTAVKTINDDVVSANGGYWQKIETGSYVIPLQYPQYVTIQGQAAQTSTWFSNGFYSFEIALNTAQE